MDSLVEWESMAHHRVSRSVDRVTRYTAAGSEEGTRWAFAYQTAMQELMDNVTQMHQLHHQHQLHSVHEALISAGMHRGLAVSHAVPRLLLASENVSVVVTEEPAALDVWEREGRESGDDEVLTDAEARAVLGALSLPSVLKEPPA